MIQLIRISGRGQITIPVSLRKKLGLSKNQQVVVSTLGNQSLRITPVTTKKLSDLYGAVDPGGKSSDPEEAIKKTREERAKEVVESG